MLREDILQCVHAAEILSKTRKHYQLQACVLELTLHSNLQEVRQTKSITLTLLRLFIKSSKVLLTNVILCSYITHSWYKRCLRCLEISEYYFPFCVTLFLSVHDRERCCHSPVLVHVIPGCYMWVRERLCVFVVPCGGEKQVAWRLKYWWMMINSCGWWKSEAHPNGRCAFWSQVLVPVCGRPMSVLWSSDVVNEMKFSEI